MCHYSCTPAAGIQRRAGKQQMMCLLTQSVYRGTPAPLNTKAKSQVTCRDVCILGHRLDAHWKDLHLLEEGILKVTTRETVWKGFSID